MADLAVSGFVPVFPALLIKSRNPETGTGRPKIAGNRNPEPETGIPVPALIYIHTRPSTTNRSLKESWVGGELKENEMDAK